MNLLQALNSALNPVIQSYAKVVGIKPDGTLIAQTQTGATVLLQGKAEIGKSVFYNRLDNKVLGDAPDVEFNEYGV